MSATRLARPEIYTPMSKDELLRLRLYRDRVDELQRFRFFAGGSETVRMFSNRDGVESAGRSDFNREGFLAVVTPFRILHDEKAPTGFVRVTKILSEHVRRDLADHGELVDSLRDLRKTAMTAANTLPMGITLEVRQPDGSFVPESITAHDLLDAWLNGEIFHDELAKHAVRKRFDPGGMGLFNLCWIIRRLNGLFIIGRDLVAPLLDAAEVQQA